jgi:hypothetical protein
MVDRPSLGKLRTCPGAFGHGRRLLGFVPIEDPVRAVELAGHVIGVWWWICQDVHRSAWWATDARSARRSMPVASTRGRTAHDIRPVMRLR